MTVHAPPPKRHDSSRCADRSSPNASPLFEAASALINSDPQRFPIHGRVGILVASSGALPQPEGYGPADAMIEVLVDAGVLADERQVEVEQYEIKQGMSGYVIDVERLGL